MKLSLQPFVAVLLALASGCQSTQVVTSSDGSSLARRSTPSKLTEFTDSVQTVTQPGRSDRISDINSLPAWNWATGIPKDVQRAEVVSATVPQNVVAALAPDWKPAGIQLVAGSDALPDARIVEANGRRISNCAQLQSVVENALSEQSSTQVVLALANGDRSTSEPLELSPNELTALSNMVASGESVMRVDEAGSPWVLIRDDATRCRMMVCVAERTRGMVQIVLSLGVCWGEQKKLPLEVRATCNGEELQCLTATDALSMLYGGSPQSSKTAASFSATSDLDEYMLPMNYKSVQQQFDKLAPLHQMAAMQPALVTLANISYPGPAPLGDARALSTMLLQQSLYEPGENERIGWILFAGDSVRDGGTISILLDLGSGPEPFSFHVPAS